MTGFRGIRRGHERLNAGAGSPRDGPIDVVMGGSSMESPAATLPADRFAMFTRFPLTRWELHSSVWKPPRRAAKTREAR